MNITPPDYPVIDGFLANTTMKCTPNFRQMARAEWDTLVRTGSYRSKQWPVPENSNIAIPAWNSYEFQIKCVPGSALWGFIWTQGANAGPFSIQVRDACTGVSAFSEPVRCDKFSAAGGSGQPAPFQQPFSRIIVLGTPGLVTVEICSQQTTDATQVQLVLCGGEPMCPS